MAQGKRGEPDRAFWATLIVWALGLVADIVLRINNISAPEVDGTLAALTGLMVGNLTTKSNKKGGDKDE